MELSSAFGKTKPRFASVLPEGAQKHPASQRMIILKQKDRAVSSEISLCSRGKEGITRLQLEILIAAHYISEQSESKLPVNRHILLQH